MDNSESLSHSKWECKHLVVFIPKCRRLTLYKELRKHLDEVFRMLARQKDCQNIEGHLMPDHVHMLIADSPKIRCFTGDRVYQGQKRYLFGQGLW